MPRAEGRTADGNVPLRLSQSEWEDVLDGLGRACEWTSRDIDCTTCADGRSCDLHEPDWTQVDQWRALAAGLRQQLTTHAPANRQPAGWLCTGANVHVHAAGTWRHGHVTTVARTRATVEYVRNRDGDISVRAFPLAEIQPAHGVRLVDVDHLTAGAVIITSDGEQTVAGVTRQPRRCRRIEFSDATAIVVNAASVLRVRDTAPPTR
jgi:hypothetical protein